MRDSISGRELNKLINYGGKLGETEKEQTAYKPLVDLTGRKKNGYHEGEDK